VDTKQTGKEKILTLPGAVARVRNKRVRIQGRNVFGEWLNMILSFKFLLKKPLNFRLAKAGRERWRNDHSPFFS